MVREKIREFVIENLMMGLDVEQLQDGGSLMDLGILDSVGVLDLIGFIEQTWSVSIADDELGEAIGNIGAPIEERDPDTGELIPAHIGETK